MLLLLTQLEKNNPGAPLLGLAKSICYTSYIRQRGPRKELYTEFHSVSKNQWFQVINRSFSVINCFVMPKFRDELEHCHTRTCQKQDIGGISRRNIWLCFKKWLLEICRIHGTKTGPVVEQYNKNNNNSDSSHFYKTSWELEIWNLNS